MKMFIYGQWVDSEEKIEVSNPYDGSTIDTVPKAGAEEVEAALAGAVEGAQIIIGRCRHTSGRPFCAEPPA